MKKNKKSSKTSEKKTKKEAETSAPETSTKKTKKAAKPTETETPETPAPKSKEDQTIREEILAAYKIKGPKDGETGQKFRARVVRLVNEGTDEQWATISEKAQSWVNAGATALLEKTGPVPPFPDEAAEKTEKAEKTEGTEEAPTSTKKSKKERKAEKAEKKAAKKAKGEKKERKNRDSNIHALRLLLVKKQPGTKKEAIKIAADAGLGLKDATVSCTFQYVKGTLRALRETGLLK